MNAVAADRTHLARSAAGGWALTAGSAFIIVGSHLGVLRAPAFTQAVAAAGLVMFGWASVVASVRIVRPRPTVEWDEYGLAVLSGRRVPWTSVTDMRITEVYGRNYLAIWLADPDASDPSVAPRMRRLRSPQREGHMTVPQALVGMPLEALLEQLAQARREASAGPGGRGAARDDRRPPE